MFHSDSGVLIIQTPNFVQRPKTNFCRLKCLLAIHALLSLYFQLGLERRFQDKEERKQLEVDRFHQHHSIQMVRILRLYIRFF